MSGPDPAGSAASPTRPTRLDDDLTVLFVCEHGSARSAMAAALLRAELPEQVRVVAAGPDPDPVLNPVAMAALTEAGVAAPSGSPIKLTDALLREADLVVSINRSDDLTAAGAHRHWQVSRTPVQTAEAARVVRDELAERTRDLAAELRTSDPEWP